MPILKQLVSGSSHTKRRSRVDLTREMISAPLGDFRHTMHVGRSGDAFGDTSFLGTRSGEPPPEAGPLPRSPRPGLLSRTFRSSKRSQSVTRVDNGLTPPTHVKNAMSLPFLNDEGGLESGGGGGASCSLSCSPLQLDSNAAAEAALLEMEERSFGALAELPGSGRRSPSRLKHAESVMSFHLDLGPSMLGDVLDVMVRDDDDLGYEEGRASPPCGPRGPEEAEPGSEEGEEEEGEEEVEAEEAEEEEDAQEEVEEEEAGPAHRLQASVEPRPLALQQRDSCSVGSYGVAAAAAAEPAHGVAVSRDTDSANFSAPAEEESNFSSFLEDEDDEIRV